MKAFSLLQTIKGIYLGLVRMYVTRCRIFLIIFTLHLVLGYTDRLHCWYSDGYKFAPLVAYLLLICYERYFIYDLYDANQADIIETFSSTTRYLDDLLNIDNSYFEGIINQIFPTELPLNKANTSDTEVSFLDLHHSTSNGFLSSKIYDKTMILILI